MSLRGGALLWRGPWGRRGLGRADTTAALPVLLLLTGSCMQSSADWLALSPLALFVQRRLWRRADTTAALPVLLVLTGSGLANQRELALRFLRRLLRGCVGACVCFAAVLPPSVCPSVCRGACSVACRVAACPACPSGPRGCGPSLLPSSAAGFWLGWLLGGSRVLGGPGPAWLGLGPCSLRNQFSSQSRFCQCTGGMLPYSRRLV